MNSKKAITLAEIIIVIVIVAVIALVFLAMPKKDVGKMDKTKYYVAYDMLKRLMDEQMAEYGEVRIDTDLKFCNEVKTWLNIVGDLDCSSSPTSATLTNGMILSWSDGYDSVNNKRDVTVDIDGSEGSSEDDKDVHKFYLLKDDGIVQPAMNEDTAWIAFKVYKFRNSGDAEFLKTNVGYQEAFECYSNTGDNACNDCNDPNSCFIEAIPPFK